MVTTRDGVQVSAVSKPLQAENNGWMKDRWITCIVFLTDAFHTLLSSIVFHFFFSFLSTFFSAFCQLAFYIKLVSVAMATPKCWSRS